MKQLWKSKPLAIVLLAAALAAPARAQAPTQTEARTYLTFAADIPFQFAVGRRTFKAGNYKFVVLGPGLLAILNTKTRVLVHLITRDTLQAEVPKTTRLIFTLADNGHSSLTSILLEHHPLGLRVVGEEVAMRQTPPQLEPTMPVDLFMPSGRLPITPRP